MKKSILILLCLSLLMGIGAVFTGCDSSTDHTGTTIVAIGFAGYDFTRSILSRYTENGGEGVVQLMILGKPGQDMHSFEPTAQDIITLAGADVVIATGAEAWLASALESSGNSTARVVSMMEACDVYGAGHDHDHGHGHENGSCALIGNDEHVWLSVDYAIRIVSGIADALKQADPENAAAWEASAEQYKTELTALHTEFRNMVKAAARKQVVVADRHPFVYLFADLGLDCVAAFPGCSSETSASFETQIKLIEFTKTHELPYIFVIEGSDSKVAEVVAGETGAEILTLNSLQVVTNFENTTYLAVMKSNLENLKKALQ
jgi:zinc transport system substrate-binding protein